jgi:hypothetical protein
MEKLTGVKARVAGISLKTVERMALLVEELYRHVEQGGSDVFHLSALFGDDDVWTIRQEIQNIGDILKEEHGEFFNA